MSEQHTSSVKIPIGISACLMGQKVRFDGGHKRSRFCTDVLAEYFDYVPLCPEVAIGMGTPRQPIRLVGESKDTTNVFARGTRDTELDVSDQLRAYGQEQGEQHKNLCGYIFMQKSPSCGLFGVKRYLDNGMPEGTARGLYAEEFCKKQPLLPVEEAGRLNDPGLRENFLVRVFAYHDWQQFLASDFSAKDLIGFHARYKYLVMAHSQQYYKSLGHLLSDLSKAKLHTIAEEYFKQLMAALAKPASRKMNTNTLMHLQGYLKNCLSSGDKQELTDLIQHYHQGIVPLIVPLTLLKHHLSHQQQQHYANMQVYLNPYPYQLGLRNAI
ncbi:MAG: DUF523 and DUF1722 domain-containing protein [Saccharospirillaceae bacterium]|nr:hypothetical protein A3759_07200 [Thalassolituus sp. HI0120]MCH2041679.1 DUF523 and DUF1722 domain-containing protein [Saccharospirillaceae bacterium]